MIKFKNFLAASVMGVTLMLPGASNASGFPVIDAASLTQMITDYMQQLKDYETQLDDLQTLSDQYTQQMKDAAKPVINAYEQAKSIVDSAQQIYTFTNSLTASFNNANDYLRSTIGNREKWEECAISSSCSLTDMMRNSYDNYKSILDEGISNTLSLEKRLKNLSIQAADAYSERIASSQGHQDIAEVTAEILNSKLKSDAEYQATVASAIIAKQTDEVRQREQREAEVKAAEKYFNVKDKMYSGKLNMGLPGD